MVQQLCLSHCFLDADKAGRDGFEKARSEGLIADSDINFANCRGKKESELEDWYEPKTYAKVVKKIFRVDINTSKFRSKKKWSLRMRDVFQAQGKQWNDRVKREVKFRIAKQIATNPANVIAVRHKPPFLALVKALEQRLKELAKART